MLEKEKGEYLDQLKRARADYENLQKRIEKEGEDSKRYGNAQLYLELVSVLEDMERAIEGGKGVRARSAKNMLKGLELIHKNFLSMLESKGLQSYEEVGQSFNPMRHEAIMSKADNGVDEDIILKCVNKGYMLHDKILIPAKVIVSKKERGDVKWLMEK